MEQSHEDMQRLKRQIRTIEAAHEEIINLRTAVERTRAEAFIVVDRILKLTSSSQGYGVDVIFDLNDLLFGMKAKIETETKKESSE